MDNICKAGSTFVSLFCIYGFFNCYSNALTVQNGMVTRLFHILIFVYYIVAAWILHNWGATLIQYVPIDGLCPEDTCELLLVYRLSFAIFTFHIILAAWLYGSFNSSDSRSIFQNRFWQLKFPLLLILIILSGFIPESFFMYYGWVTFLGAIMFLLLQIFYIVDFSHTVIECAINTADQILYRSTYLPTIVIFSLSMLSIAIGLVVYMIFLLRELSDCHVNLPVIVLNMIVIVACAVASYHPKITEKNSSIGLFQLSVLALFSTYSTWNAVIVDDPGQCTLSFIHQGPVYWITVIIGTIFALVVCIYSSINITTNDSESYNYSKTNSLFALATLYVAMLLTNWSVIRRYEGNEVETSLSWVPVVLDIFALILLCIIYIWMAIAPAFFDNRDFRSIASKKDEDLPM